MPWRARAVDGGYYTLRTVLERFGLAIRKFNRDSLHFLSPTAIYSFSIDVPSTARCGCNSPIRCPGSSTSKASSICAGMWPTEKKVPISIVLLRSCLHFANKFVHLPRSRFVIRRAVVRKDLIQTLPLPRRLLDYLSYKNCYSEQIESDSSQSPQPDDDVS